MGPSSGAWRLSRRTYVRRHLHRGWDATYLRFGLSYRDLEELLAERGIDVDDETYVKVCGVWRYAYRAVDQHVQIIDVYVSRRRDIAAARRFIPTPLTSHGEPVEAVTDRVAALAHVIDELLPAAFHNTGQYQNNRCEADHGRLTAGLRPMRGSTTDLTASVVMRGHAFIQNLRRGHYELRVDTVTARRLATAFHELRGAV